MRVAIVGAGYIARVHARIARELGGDVVAVCGQTLASAETFGIGMAYDNLGRLLAEQRPDVVHICTPNNLHAGKRSRLFEPAPTSGARNGSVANLAGGGIPGIWTPVG